MLRFGQFPEPRKTPTIGGDLPQENRPVAADDEQPSRDVVGPWPRPFDRQLVLESENARLAPLCDRAFGAARALGKADGCAQLHHGLIEIAGPPAIENRISRRAQTRSRFGVSQLAFVGSHAREHSQDVAIHCCPSFAECDAGDSRRRVRSDTRQLANRIMAGRICPCFSNLPRGSLQVARTRIISEPRPTGQNIALRRAREGLGSRIALQKSLVIRKHSSDARLLQHNLRDVNRPRIALAPPWQVALVVVVPSEQGAAKLRR